MTLICYLFVLSRLQFALSRIQNKNAPARGDVNRIRHYQNGLDFLTCAYDIRAVGPLAEAFWLRPMPSGVAGALTRLLRVQAQTAETARLSLRQWQCLTRILTLRGATETTLQIAILDCLAASGQTRALPAVLKLAHDAACAPALQTAAQNCLLTLQEQATDASQRQTLLRPPHIPPAELLRPTSPLAEDAPELLLRASGHDDIR